LLSASYRQEPSSQAFSQTQTQTQPVGSGGVTPPSATTTKGGLRLQASGESLPPREVGAGGGSTFLVRTGGSSETSGSVVLPSGRCSTSVVADSISTPKVCVCVSCAHPTPPTPPFPRPPSPRPSTSSPDLLAALLHYNFVSVLCSHPVYALIRTMLPSVLCPYYAPIRSLLHYNFVSIFMFVLCSHPVYALPIRLHP
jgi:hypothetical protein